MDIYMPWWQDTLSIFYLPKLWTTQNLPIRYSNVIYPLIHKLCGNILFVLRRSFVGIHKLCSLSSFTIALMPRCPGALIHQENTKHWGGKHYLWKMACPSNALYFLTDQHSWCLVLLTGTSYFYIFEKCRVECIKTRVTLKCHILFNMMRVFTQHFSKI